MAFAKKDIRSILREAGIESDKITTSLLDEICELHMDTQKEVVKDELSKVNVKETEEYKILQEKYEEVTKNGNFDVKETQDYKDLLKSFDDFKSDIEKGKVKKQSVSARRKELEKLGIKGSALDLILKDDFKIEFDEKGQAKEESIKSYVDSIKKNYHDLIVVDQGSGGAKPNTNTNHNNQKVDFDELDKMSMEDYAKYRKGEN